MLCTHCGVEEGAQTTAKDSGNMRWKPECVCRSTDDMKPGGPRSAWKNLKLIGINTGDRLHDCVGCVCICKKNQQRQYGLIPQPNRRTSRILR